MRFFHVVSLLAVASTALLATLPIAAQSSQTHPWTIKEIFGGESLTGDAPGDISWSPDGKRATYIADSGDVMQIDTADGKLTTLVQAQKIARLLNAPLREKDRDHRNRYNQPDYIWSPDSTHMLFNTDGELWNYDLASGQGATIGNTGMQSGDDPKFSPDGARVSYVRDHNLYVQPVKAGGAAVALTATKEPTLLNGEIDWVYLEELDTRSNYFWSPDSKQIAYLQVDEAKVPEYPLTDWIPVHATVDEQRYPQPGDPNPGVRVGVVSAEGGATQWLKIPLSTGNDYIPRFGWVSSHVVWVEVLTRDQKHRDLYFADTRTGAVKRVLAETEPKYFTIAYDFIFVGDHQFLNTGWQDGYTHIYRYTFDAAHPLGEEVKPAGELEHGEYEVSEIKAVDEAKGTVYYLSNEGNPRDQQVWAVQLDGTGKRRVTQTDGFHDPEFAQKGGAFIDTSSTLITPPVVSYCTGSGTGAGACTPFWRSHAVAGHTVVPPVNLELTAADGKTKLFGTLQLPVGERAAASVPLIVNPYGGPGVGTAKNKYGNRGWYFDQLLAEHGFAVLHVDNRGMAGRGRDFEQAAYHSFGPAELADQLASVDQVLAKYPQIDGHRMGWWGWSWGGSFTLYALSHSDRFLAGGSGAPVTDWRLYDSIYTERYMGLPSEDAKAYHDDSDVNSADRIHGHIVIFHGTGDDNVHLGNTVQYIQKLIDAGIPYDYNIFPRKTHSVAGPEAQTELHIRLLQQFEQYVMHPELGKDEQGQ
ncbi:DPP IV N-terminal domain-containing protein [Silvibacterium dinghuense]|uniref:Dipeptidyl-peptidase IV n=1 Tax=Silvibacterium dinghuense TaxID=1560006 RepID=A0A4V1NVV3_9BACT|nr:DPP IV N-terminal domain-containing protein [Silvibacterium dinghuense]RXS97222.1 dipeptidyl-peptidase IV [Silvibacterium dinghuense]GGG97203.1 peptidase S9 [Silvibacterium dinghuense]